MPFPCLLSQPIRTFFVRPVVALAATLLLLMACGVAHATPANKAGLEKFFGRFLPTRLDACTTCHLPAKGNTPPTSLADFPHNAFGHRLALAAEELRSKGRKTDIATRLRYIAQEDSDGDGVDNLTELLLGHAPGDPKDHPSAKELAQAPQLRAAFAHFLAEYRWQPFEPVRRPPIPQTSGKRENTQYPIPKYPNQQPATSNQFPNPIAALLTDLKQRGMLEETLVVWGTEFGRSPGAQATGRDHHPHGFSAWLAGGGIKGGVAHGVTDELGFHAVEDRHYVTDIHATVLHQMGLDSHRLEVPGRKRLAIDHGQPITAIIA